MKYQIRPASWQGLSVPVTGGLAYRNGYTGTQTISVCRMILTRLLTILRWHKVCHAQTIAGIPRQVLENSAPTLFVSPLDNCWQAELIPIHTAMVTELTAPDLLSSPEIFITLVKVLEKKKSDMPNITFWASFYKIPWPVLSVEATTNTLATSVYWIAAEACYKAINYNSTIWKPKARPSQTQLRKVTLMISANHITLGCHKKNKAISCNRQRPASCSFLLTHRPKIILCFAKNEVTKWTLPLLTSLVNNLSVQC